jgi:hypothetical protein
MQKKIEREEVIWKQVEPEYDIFKGMAFFEKYMPYKIKLKFISNTSPAVDFYFYELVDGAFLLKFDGMSVEAANEINSESSRLSQLPNSRVVARINTQPPHPYLIQSLSDNKEFLTEFLAIIDNNVSLGNLKQELFALRGLEVAEKITEALTSNKIDEAMKLSIKAQEQANFSPIWNLAQELLSKKEEIISSQDLFDFLEKISLKNPYYHDAQFELAHILFTQPSSELEEENIARLEAAFKHALISGEKNQHFIDKIFHLLCGREGRELAVIKNIKGDYETLIEIAKQTRLLIQENKALKSAQSAAPHKDSYSSSSHKAKEKGKEKEAKEDQSDLKAAKEDSFWNKRENKKANLQDSNQSKNHKRSHSK